MILRTGVDLIEIERVRSICERYDKRFLERVYTHQELAEVGKNMSSLAARFAAKEAVAKALGTGIGPVAWQEIEIRRGPDREPMLFLYGQAQTRAAELGIHTWSLSLSHSLRYAVAFVVALGAQAGKAAG
jgi:holo-[acyl-carrier protein] synthase